MKIRLPLPLVGKSDKDGIGIGTVHSSDDMSCSSGSSEKSSLSRRSFSLSPRTSRLRGRPKPRSFREESTKTTTSPKITGANTDTKNIQSPGKKPAIIKRLQKSCNAILNNSNNHQRKSSMHQGKENAFPSSNSTHSSVDSMTVSLPDIAFPLPSSATRPSPSDRVMNTKKAGARFPKGNNGKQRTKAMKKSEGNKVTQDKQTTKKNSIDTESNCNEDQDDRYSPTSVATANSLLPPLYDSDEEEEMNQFTEVEDDIRYESRFVTDKKTASNNQRNVASSHTKVSVAGISSGDTQSKGTKSCSLTRSGGKSVSSCKSLEAVKYVADDSDDDGTGTGVAAGKSKMVPPKEVVAITSTLKKPKREQSNQGGIAVSPDKNGIADSGFGKDCRYDVAEIEDDEKKIAQDLAVKLVRDLEEVREESERYASKNRRLESKFQKLKAQQDENMIHRGRLVKACLYTSPVFLLCGGLDAFLSTILLVWVLVEVDGYLDLSDEALDREEDEGNSDGEDGDDSDDDVDDLDDNSSMSL